MPRLRIEITPFPQYPNHKVAVSPHDTATFSFSPIPLSSILISIHPTPTKKSPTKVQIRTATPTSTPYLCTNKPEREQTGARASCPRITHNAAHTPTGARASSPRIKTTPPTTLKSLPPLTSLKSYHVHHHRLPNSHPSKRGQDALSPPPATIKEQGHPALVQKIPTTPPERGHPALVLIPPTIQIPSGIQYGSRG